MDEGAHPRGPVEGAADERANDGSSPPVEERRIRGQALLRLAFYGTVAALALVRFWLNPPVHLPIVLILATWYVTAGVFFALRPREPGAGCLAVALRFVFFVYEVSAVVVVTHHLGGTGWLTVLLLVYPVVEMNVLGPGRAGVAASAIALAACTAMAALEALGWLPHDPFYSVADPLYREPAYVLLVLLVGTLVLGGLPAGAARWRSGP
ncbi:MAG: hypothetical protein JSV86_16615 [Gemmatimonadota bacterium]|nr:MAG: hypothetical protein JSV86_16615 [Gemmatimonadota bacterium]